MPQKRSPLYAIVHPNWTDFTLGFSDGKYWPTYPQTLDEYRRAVAATIKAMPTNVIAKLQPRMTATEVEQFADLVQGPTTRATPTILAHLETCDEWRDLLDSPEVETWTIADIRKLCIAAAEAYKRALLGMVRVIREPPVMAAQAIERELAELLG